MTTEFYIKDINPCELCLKRSNDILKIFQDEESESEIAQMLVKFFWFDVSSKQIY